MFTWSYFVLEVFSLFLEIISSNCMLFIHICHLRASKEFSLVVWNLFTIFLDKYTQNCELIFTGKDWGSSLWPSLVDKYSKSSIWSCIMRTSEFLWAFHCGLHSHCSISKHWLYFWQRSIHNSFPRSKRLQDKNQANMFDYVLCNRRCSFQPHWGTGDSVKESLLDMDPQ